MSFWKEILFAGDEENIGNSNLTITGGDSRRLSFGNASSDFAVKNNATYLVLKLTETEATLGSTVSTGTLKLNSANGTMTMGSAVTSFTTPQFNISSTNTGSGAQPLLNLKRNSASPAAGDDLARIRFIGENASSHEKQYASVTAHIADTTLASESGDLSLAVVSDGSDYEFFRGKGDGLGVKAEMSSKTFSLTTDVNGASENPVLQLRRKQPEAENDDVIGVIKFTGQDDIIDNAPDGYELAGVEFYDAPRDYVVLSAESQIATQSNPTGKFKLELLDGVDNYITAAEFKADVLTGQQATESIKRLDAVSMHGKTLRELTDKFFTNFTCGMNGHSGNSSEITNVAGQATTTRFLRLANGVECIGGADWDASRGMVMAHDGHVISGGLCYTNGDTTAGGADIRFGVRIYNGADSDHEDYKEIEIADITPTMSQAGQPAMHGTVSINTTSGNYTSNNFSAGDKIVPYVTCDALSQGKTYQMERVMAHFTLYQEYSVKQ